MNISDVDPWHIDLAIHCIKTGRAQYSCHALHDAYELRTRRPEFDSYKDNPLCILYKESCKLPPKRKDRTFSMPWWWGRCVDAQKARLKALETFKQHVMEAKARATKPFQ